MKKLLVMLIVLSVTAIAFAGPADTIYNQRGEGVQVYAPNFFQTMTVNVTEFPLSNTLAFEVDSPTDCKMWIHGTTGQRGTTPQRVLADTPKLRGKGYGMAFVTYSGCTSGVYSAMKGDWSGQ